jgi:SEC-C motif
MTQAELEEMQAQAIQDVKRQCDEIAVATVPDDQVWFRNLLWAFLNCALTDYRFVEIGAQKSASLAAWGRRNLLETKVFTEFVLRSEANALAFRTELFLDSKEFYEAVGRSHAATHKQYVAGLADFAKALPDQMRQAVDAKVEQELKDGPDTAASDAEAKMFTDFLSDEMGVTGTPQAKRSPEIAGLLGEAQKEAFGPMFQICSKLLHRTALSIAAATTRGSLDAIVPFLQTSAFNDLLSISGLIKQYVDTEGIRDPAHKPLPNDKCPCGSGKRFKRCHGAVETGVDPGK